MGRASSGSNPECIPLQLIDISSASPCGLRPVPLWTALAKNSGATPSSSGTCSKQDTRLSAWISDPPVLSCLLMQLFGFEVSFIRAVTSSTVKTPGMPLFPEPMLHHGPREPVAFFPSGRVRASCPGATQLGFPSDPGRPDPGLGWYVHR